MRAVASANGQLSEAIKLSVALRCPVLGLPCKQESGQLEPLKVYCDNVSATERWDLDRDRPVAVFNRPTAPAN